MGTEVIFYIIAGLMFILNIIFVFLSARINSFKFCNEDSVKLEKFPTVSFLIAARNEEGNIGHCIESILNQNYPSDKVQILVGDDNSNDKTFEKAHSFNQVEVIKITSNEAGLIGKSNVLAQLEKKATGTLLAFTDADITLPNDWLMNMASECIGEVGIVSGITQVSEHSYQNFDWIMSLAMVKTVSDFNVPVTAVGNNMVISKLAYEDVGGYEFVGQSIIEDYDLFQLIVKKYKFKNLFSPQVLANSKPVNGFINLLMQRKRWMSGALKLPFPILIVLMLQAAFYPLVFGLIAIDYKTAFALWGVKLFFQSVYIAQLFIKLKEKISFFKLIMYEIHSAILSVCLLIFYILPVKINWKGRKY